MNENDIKNKDVSNRSKYFLYVAILFVATLMISNTVAVKIIQIGGFFFTGAILIFPLTYIFGDILTEVYGYKASRKIIWSGLVANVLMSLGYFLVQTLSPAPFWPNQGAYEIIFGIVPRIVLASIVGYFVGEFCNSYVLSKIKILMRGKHLWIRTISSTIVGEGVDTFLFVTIGFIGTIPTGNLVMVIISGYLFKVFYEILATPLTYLIVNRLKKAEGVDVYDVGVNYNPFSLKK